MNKLIFFFSSFFLWIALPVWAQDVKPRVLVLTDIGGDPDDQQSLVRFLLYTNLFEVEGICATSRLGHGQDTKPEFIKEQVEAYGKVLPNLSLHAQGYPSKEYLLSKIKNGSGNQHQVGEGFDTEASNWIITAGDKPDSRPLWIPVWGGSRELAQALWKVKNTRLKKDADEFAAKLRVYLIDDQDGHKNTIIKTFPNLFVVSSGFANHKGQKTAETAVFRGQYMTGDVSMQDKNWVSANIVNQHGPLGELYPINAHGSNGMKEGDTPSFNYIINNGLNFPEQPEWGGWGGRFRHITSTNYITTPQLYIDGLDLAFGDLNERHTVSRWRPYFQRDFQARMDWCVKTFADANHAPAAVIDKNNTRNYISVAAKVGEVITLDGSASSDPDGDKISFKWWFYPEPSKYQGSVHITNAQFPKTQIKVPVDAKGKILHFILEVSDNGTPVLTSFRRVLVHVE